MILDHKTPIMNTIVTFGCKRKQSDSCTLHMSFIFQDDSNRSLLSEKKFSKECIRCCVLQNKTMSSIEVGEVAMIVMFHNLWYFLSNPIFVAKFGFAAEEHETPI